MGKIVPGMAVPHSGMLGEAPLALEERRAGCNRRCMLRLIHAAPREPALHLLSALKQNGFNITEAIKRPPNLPILVNIFYLPTQPVFRR